MALTVTHRADIDISPGSTVDPVINLSQYDAGATIELTVYNDGVLFPTAGLLATVHGRKADRHVFLYSVVCGENTVTFDTTNQMTAADGDTMCEVRLRDSVTLANVGTANFTLQIEESPLKYSGDFSDTDIPSIIEIDRAIAAAEAARVAQGEAEESAADAADSATTATEQATIATNQATAAAASATTATEQATIATNQATAAAASATTATEQATSASNSAATATQKASDAAASATAAAASQSAIENMSATASTLPVGSSATVTKSTIDDHVNLAFGIPRGDVGPQGEQGPPGDVPVVEMTVAEYDLLPDADKQKNILYCLTDGVPEADAGNVSYDNTTSGLSATTVQAAIDEAVDNAKDIKVNMGTISSLPTTKSVVGLPVSYEVTKSYLGTSSAQTGEWDVTTAWDATNNKTTITVSGTISGSTTLVLWFGPVKELTAT